MVIFEFLLWLSFGPYVLGQTGASFHTICTTLVDENVDPVVSPGKWGWGHAHRVVGANGFHSRSTPLSRIKPEFDVPTSIYRNSTGTTCDIPLDLSVYWQPILYYQLASNKNLIRINDGPALNYYNFYKGFQVFPGNYKLIIGKPTRTKYSGDPENPAIHFEYPVGNKIYDFPNVTCSNTMLRAHVFFPHCAKINSVTKALLTDSNGNYIMNYPIGFRTGAERPKLSGTPFRYEGYGCPADHIVLPQLHQSFHYSIRSICPNGKLLPGRFIWSNGNPDGRGLHADFLNGWDRPLLTRVGQQCLKGRCARNGNGCPANICEKNPKKPTYSLKEGTYDYTGPADGSGIPPSVYLLDQDKKPSWGFNLTLSESMNKIPISIHLSPVQSDIFITENSPSSTVLIAALSSLFAFICIGGMIFIYSRRQTVAPEIKIYNLDSFYANDSEENVTPPQPLENGTIMISRVQDA